MRLDDTTLNALTTSLAFRKMRNDLHAANIANAETPNYKAKQLDFEEALARAIDIDGQENMKTNDDRHFNVGNGGFNNLEPEVYESPNGVVQANGNTVDRDHEELEQAKNLLQYNATIQLVNKKLALMKYISSADR